MAKYDHGGGCPCGLYAECGDDCQYPKGTTAEGAIVPSKLYSADRLTPVAEHPEDVWIRDMFAEPKWHE